MTQTIILSLVGDLPAVPTGRCSDDTGPSRHVGAASLLEPTAARQHSAPDQPDSPRITAGIASDSTRRLINVTIADDIKISDRIAAGPLVPRPRTA